MTLVSFEGMKPAMAGFFMGEVPLPSWLFPAVLLPAVLRLLPSRSSSIR